MKLTKNSLVLYKQTPACVTGLSDKLTIVLPNGKEKNVRDKDVILLHPGPLPAVWQNLENDAPEGNPEEAWELLQGEAPGLEELAELVYGSFTPTTAWLTYKLINRTPWFKGVPNEIIIVDPETVATRIQADREKAESELRWTDFFDRFQKKLSDPVADELFLRDLELLALGKCKGSRILKSLNRTQTPENAHRILLEYGVKPDTWNPHPLRLNIDLVIPDYPVADFPSPGTPKYADRLDLTDVEAFAIDDEGNTDPDDAICWDGERFWVHVADTAALYPKDSPQDRDARERASSLYLPEIVYPMLPHAAVEKLGLGLAETSHALSYAFKINDSMEVTDFSVHLTTVRVTRLNYADTDKIMDKEPFATMQRITRAFADRRNAAGAVNINMPEVKVRVDRTGEIHITPLPDLPSRRMVTESMLMAGSYAADYCRERNIPIPYTVQEVDTIDQPEVPSSTPEINPPINYVTEFNRRRGMKRSRTTLDCGPHGGLGLDAYTRITSPMRRYPDLIASRQIRRYLLGAPLESAESVLEGLAMFESRIGSLIQAERRSIRFWKLLWLKRHPGFCAQAWLMDKFEKQGIFLIPEIAMETRLPLKKDMEPGSEVMLKLKEVDIAESSVLFLVEGPKK